MIASTVAQPTIKSKRKPVVFFPTWSVKIVQALTKNGWTCTPDASVKHDALCLVDGPPISPFLYGEKKLEVLKCDVNRDMQEQGLLRRTSAHVPKLGIGRGAHLLNCYNGGSSWQLANNHAGSTIHKCVDFTNGNELWLSTNHLQVMLPSDRADVLLVAKDSATMYEGYGNAMSVERGSARDIEACMYAETNALCYQPTEFQHQKTTEYFLQLVKENIVFSDNNVEI